LADPDGVEADYQRRLPRRQLWLARTFDGVWAGRLNRDPVSGAIVSGELGRIETAMFGADWAAARDRFGRKPAPARYARCPWCSGPFHPLSYALVAGPR
jgi:hypothetical protein